MRRHRAFSVIEVLIASALAAMLLSAVVTGLVVVTQSVRTNDATMRARQAGTRALELITSKVRRASALGLSNPTAVADEYTTLATCEKGDWSEFSFSEGKLYFKRGLGEADPKQPLLNNVQNVVFRSANSVADPVWRDVSIEITMSVDEAYSKDQTPFSITGAASARSLEPH